MMEAIPIFPLEIWYHILQSPELGPPSSPEAVTTLVNCSLVSKAMLQICRSDAIWRVHSTKWKYGKFDYSEGVFKFVARRAQADKVARATLQLFWRDKQNSRQHYNRFLLPDLQMNAYDAILGIERERILSPAPLNNVEQAELSSVNLVGAFLLRREAVSRLKHGDGSLEEVVSALSLVYDMQPHYLPQFLVNFENKFDEYLLLQSTEKSSNAGLSIEEIVRHFIKFCALIGIARPAANVELDGYDITDMFCQPRECSPMILFWFYLVSLKPHGMLVQLLDIPNLIYARVEHRDNADIQNSVVYIDIDNQILYTRKQMQDKFPGEQFELKLKKALDSEAVVWRLLQDIKRAINAPRYSFHKPEAIYFYTICVLTKRRDNPADVATATSLLASVLKENFQYDGDALCQEFADVLSDGKPILEKGKFKRALTRCRRGKRWKLFQRICPVFQVVLFLSAIVNLNCGDELVGKNSASLAGMITMTFSLATTYFSYIS